MRRLTILMAVMAQICVAFSVLAADAPAAPPAAPPAPAPVAATTPIGSGPYRAVMDSDPSLPTHTLYHPADLAAAGKLPIVAWGNGACWNVGL